MNDLCVFDLQHNRWDIHVLDEGTCPCPRKGHSAVVYDGAIYVFGGISQGGALGDFWVCHETPQAWRWTKLNPFSQDLQLHNHTAVYFARAMWVFGGASGEQNSTSNSLYQFIFDERAWKLHSFPASTVAPRNRHTAVMVGSNMIVLGGCGLVGPHDFARDSLVCDLKKVEWSVLQIDLPEEIGEDDDSLEQVCLFYNNDLSFYSFHTRDCLIHH